MTGGSARMFALVFLTIILGLVAVVRLGNTGRAELRDYQVRGCDSGNGLRGYLLLRAQSLQNGTDPHAQLAPGLFPIVDCITRDPVTGQVQDRFLELLTSGRLGIVRGGQIVWSRPIEQP